MSDDVQLRPARECLTLKQSVLYCLISYIPSGKVITVKQLEKYLMERYRLENVIIDAGSFNFDAAKSLYVDRAVPLWRLLSELGYVRENRFFMSREKTADKLRGEGHIVSDKYRVMDYKETTADIPCLGWEEALAGEITDLFEKFI